VELLEALKERLGDLALEIKEERPGYYIVSVKPENLVDAARRLVDLGFDHVASVEGVDWIKEKEIEVAYHAESYEEDLRGFIVKLSTRVPRDDPRIPTLIDVWPSAEFPERETWEMLGVVFEGHPDLRHILLPPDYEGIPPLRKDYRVPVEGFIVDLTKQQPKQ
jgi:NADH-quinone oxidoreductase subunit C